MLLYRSVMLSQKWPGCDLDSFPLTSKSGVYASMSFPGIKLSFVCPGFPIKEVLICFS